MVVAAWASLRGGGNCFPPPANLGTPADRALGGFRGDWDNSKWPFHGPSIGI